MRARAGLERLVSRQYYDGLMSGEHNKPDEVVKNLRPILRIMGGQQTQGSVQAIKATNCWYDKIGTSPINRTEAAIIKSLVKQFFEYGACSTIATEDAPARGCSILATTPYQEQAQLIHQTDSRTAVPHVCSQEPG